MENVNEISTICIDEVDKIYKDIVTTSNIKTGETGPVITIKAPKGKKIKMLACKTLF